MKLSVIRNLQIGFGLSLLLFIGISVASDTSIQNLLQSADLVDHSNLVILKLENTISTMKDAEWLVNNAIKYAPGSKEIHIHIQKENDMAKISVTDKGPGIAAEKLPHLFERYYQADSNEVQHPGLGLGLYISSEIIKKHDGQIGATGELGKGSTLWFTLPLRQ